MRAINHALTGAVIGLAVPSPWLALPAALASHFVCDAIPHYGTSKEHIASKLYAAGLLIDVSLCLALVVILGVSQELRWLQASICAFLATAPDLLWIPGYVRVRQGRPFRVKQQTWLMRFAANIQWFERPIGALVEVAWFIAASAILTALIVS